MTLQSRFFNMNITLQNENLLLHPCKAIWWERQSALLIADPHFGKVAHFRRSGIAVPGKAGERDWAVLHHLLEEFSQAKEVIFLGDLFHSDMTPDWRIFEDMLAHYAHIRFTLVMGNHDIMPNAVYQQTGMNIIEEQLVRAPFIISHHPMKEVPVGFYNLSGHIHPGVLLRGKGRQFITLPCFFFGKEGGILPAFGYFTGLYRLKPQEGDKVFVVSSESVIPV
jgi:DNA ligase-associated metallophosphoesterase